MSNRRAGELSIVPVRGQGYVYLAVYPWPPNVQPLKAFNNCRFVLLELAPFRAPGSTQQFKHTYEQDWPRDVARYHAALGYEPSLTGDGVPLIDPQLLNEDKSLLLDYMTVGAIDQDGPISSKAEWLTLREGLQRSLLPVRWEAPATCRAICHMAGRELVVLLTPSRSRAHEWLSALIGAWSNTTAVPRQLGQAAARAVAEWVVDRAEGVGVHNLRWHLGRGSEGYNLELTGTWGRAEPFPADVGRVINDHFEASIAVPDSAWMTDS